MSPVPQGSLVLVTGASGFIGTHTVQALLKAGYKTRIVARSAAKAEHVRALFPGQEDKITHAVVEDISVPHAYDQAVVGVDAVVHLASPVTMSAAHPDLVVKPAVAGVENLLEGIAKFNPDIKRFVQISSVAAVGRSPQGAPGTTEANWHDQAVEAYKTLGKDTPGPLTYAAAKTLAERAFWNWIAEHKPTWDAVALNPAFVMGAPTQYATGTGAITSSLSLAVPWLIPGSDPSGSAPALKVQVGSFVDVSDVATPIVLALEAPSEDVAGKRFILSAGTLFGTDLAAAALRTSKVSEDPAYAASLVTPIDDTERAEIEVGSEEYSGKEAERVFGFKYKSRDDCLGEMAEAVSRALIAGGKL